MIKRRNPEMKRTETLIKFEKALVSDPELRKKLELAVKEAVESGACKTGSN